MSPTKRKSTANFHALMLTDFLPLGNGSVCGDPVIRTFERDTTIPCPPPADMEVIIDLVGIGDEEDGLSD